MMFSETLRIGEANKRKRHEVFYIQTKSNILSEHADLYLCL